MGKPPKPSQTDKASALKAGGIYIQPKGVDDAFVQWINDRLDETIEKSSTRCTK